MGKMNFFKAFNEDTVLQNTFKNLVEKYSPEVLLETGTYEGDTTEYFVSFGIPVISTEWFEHNYVIAKEKFKDNRDVVLFLGDSAAKISENFNLIQDKKVIAFLDSHGQEDHSCERELEVLSKLNIKPVILIHDFNVPGKNFQGGGYDGHPYDYKYFKSYFDAVYGENEYTYSYNEDATGARVGVIILEPK